MPDPQSSHPLTVDGVPLPDGPLALVPQDPPAPPSDRIPDKRYKSGYRGFMVKPYTPAAATLPLLDQMHIEWMRLAQKDRRIKLAGDRKRESQFAIQRAEADVRLRLRQLRQVAVETIQRRSGVRHIPGASIASSTTKKDVLNMSEQLRKLIVQRGFIVPPELGGQQ